jgi:hypothetical protein
MVAVFGQSKVGSTPTCCAVSHPSSSAEGLQRPAVSSARRTHVPSDWKDTMTLHAPSEPRDQLGALYEVLLLSQSCFDEFKLLLCLYQLEPDCADDEPPEAAALRQQLNNRIRGWIDGEFDGLTASQTIRWREIIVDEGLPPSGGP